MKTQLLCLPVLLLAQAALAQRPPAPVEVSTAEMRKLAPTITAAGQVQSRAGADLAAGVSGPLAWVAEPGTRVQSGEAVARLDLDELKLARSEQAARLTRGQVALKQAERELERLRASGAAVSRLQLDQAENARDLAQADLEIGRAALSQTDDRLARGTLRAPFAGVVAERRKRAGEEVSRGEVIARLTDTDHLEVRLYLPLRHVRAITGGSTVQLVLDDGRRVAAQVRALIPVGDARSQSFETLIDLPADALLAVGHSLRVELPLESPKLALVVPRDAVVIRGDGMAVYKVKQDKDAASVQRVVVKTTGAEGSYVAVEGGLAANDTVVVRGAENLHDGDAVKIIGTRKT